MMPSVVAAQAAKSGPGTDATSAAVDAPEEAIVVTGSRLAVSGYTAPTPVTVVGEELIQRDAKISIGDTIRELPAVGASSSPNNGQGAGNIVGGITGLDTINLRQLGVTRTLVLFDGQRVTQSNVTGQVDIGTMPTMLVQRIDVVTGGASAAYGSDAVAGVVNLILNRNFDGLRISAEGGNNSNWDQRSYRLQMAAGTGFAGDKGRLIFAANHQDSPQTIFSNQRSWNRYTQLVNNPAFAVGNGQPRLIHADNVGLSNATTGGLITNVATNPASLRNIQFGPNGTTSTFTPGIVSGGVASDVETLHPSISNLTTEFRATTLFGYGSYEVADWLRISLQGNYGRTRARNNSVPYTRLGNIVVRSDNAFLPQSVRDQLTAAGATQFNFGTTNMNNITPGDYDLDDFEQSLGIPVAVTERTLKRGVLSFEGDIGGGWTYNAYAQIGKVIVDQSTTNNTIVSNYNKAIDAVRNTGGQIVCRVNADTNPANDDPACVPLNIFGTGVASPEAIAYTNIGPGVNFQRQDLEQQVYALSFQGTLPFSMPAGEIPIAFGGEYRTEEGNITVDAGAAARIYPVANFVAFSGKYNVKEAFVELDVPIIKDGFIKSLNINGAARVTDYSTSGTVTTWKVGVTSELNDSIRLRATYSRDIRAPNLNELFSAGISTQGQFRDPRQPAGSPLVTVFSVVSGNPDLDPEVAKTFAAGVVLRPSFLDRFTLSVDYYNIAVAGSIESVSTTQIEDRCLAGEQVFCESYVYNSAGQFVEFRRAPLNLASRKTSGLDFQADWSVPLFTGNLQFRLLGNYVITGTQELLGNVNSFVGSLGADSTATGFPRARGNFSATYASGPFSGTFQTRFIGAAKLNVDWGPLDVDDNSIPPIAYIDLRASYQLTEEVQLFGAVDNLLNTAPPNVAAGPTRGFSVTYFAPIRNDIYDAIGTSFRVGARLKF
ncbi:TonB-dependent receptor domain-containing protein [Polymorphobacter sp.]|uniref:TonB-dependent receptor domain-containing protein n=1 Tax=Polymorphobacter sp. TaxID=1909290 RepID=UPI003F6FA156